MYKKLSDEKSEDKTDDIEEYVNIAKLIKTENVKANSKINFTILRNKNKKVKHPIIVQNSELSSIVYNRIIPKKEFNLNVSYNDIDDVISFLDIINNQEYDYSVNITSVNYIIQFSHNVHFMIIINDRNKSFYKSDEHQLMNCKIIDYCLMNNFMNKNIFVRN